MSEKLYTEAEVAAIRAEYDLKLHLLNDRYRMVNQDNIKRAHERANFCQQLDLYGLYIGSNGAILQHNGMG